MPSAARGTNSAAGGEEGGRAAAAAQPGSLSLRSNDSTASSWASVATRTGVITYAAPRASHASELAAAGECGGRRAARAAGPLHRPPERTSNRLATFPNPAAAMTCPVKAAGGRATACVPQPTAQPTPMAAPMFHSRGDQAAREAASAARASEVKQRAGMKAW